MKNGFTLVELSIVLVIIGLLVGGILVGQSLIESAKLQSEVRKLSQWSTAFIQFRSKFRQEAGDSNLFTAKGNNDGDTNGIIGPCPNRVLEYYSACSHLSESKMINEQYVWPDPNPFCPTAVASSIPYAPSYENPIDGESSSYNYRYYNSGIDYGGVNYHRYYRLNYAPAMLWGLENKLDDKIPSMTSGTISSNIISQAQDCTLANAEAQDADKCTVTIYFSKNKEMPLLAN